MSVGSSVAKNHKLKTQVKINQIGYAVWINPINYARSVMKQWRKTEILPTIELQQITNVHRQLDKQGRLENCCGAKGSTS